MPRTGGFTPDLGILFTRKRGLLLFSKLIRFKFKMRIQRGNSHLALLRGNSPPRTLDFARDVM